MAPLWAPPANTWVAGRAEGVRWVGGAEVEPGPAAARVAEWGGWWRSRWVSGWAEGPGEEEVAAPLAAALRSRVAPWLAGWESA